MQNTRSFGRRAAPAGQDWPKAAAAAAPAPRADIAETPSAAAEMSVDDELGAWKRTRRSNVRIAWRPLSLMASLCFGIASFVLPDWVSSAVQWPLFALAAASLYAGIAKRRAE